MSWISGSDIAEDVWNAVKSHLPKKKRQGVAEEILAIFEGRDCDNLMGSDLWDTARPDYKYEDDEDE